MTCWWAIPSARPLKAAQACFDAWAGLGFKTAALRDDSADCAKLRVDLFVSPSAYPGWAASINHLAKLILDMDPDCAVICTGGDDCYPDLAFPAGRVEAEMIEHFGGTLGVIQSVGEVPGYVPWSRGMIDNLPVQYRIAWAPMLGREWCRRAYGGKGPLWDAPHHFFSDEHLQLYAKRLGLYWQRPDMRLEHRTWKHDGGRRPPHLMHTAPLWESDKALFLAAKNQDFPLLPD